MEQGATQEPKWWTCTAVKLCLIGETMREGQDLTSPQYFVVVKRAEQEIFEWVAFKTIKSFFKKIIFLN